MCFQNSELGHFHQQLIIYLLNLFFFQDNALALTLRVLLAIKSAQIEDVVANLSQDDIDILMKYIYRGFEYPSEGSSGHLLLWHEKVYNIGGTGSIVRVLSDRMKV